MLSAIEERRARLLSHLAAARYASVAELSQVLGYSAATVKRDLQALERTGQLHRTRGGATFSPQDKIDIPYLMKVASFGAEPEKDRVAGLAQQLIRDDMTLVLDSSTTALHLVRYLNKFRGLRIITNGVMTAMVVSEHTDAQVCILGGEISSKHQTIRGSKAYNDMLSYNVDLAITSCRGFGLETGATEVSEGDALIKQAMRRQATELAVLFTSDKLDKAYLNRGLALSDIDVVVTDAELSSEQLAALDASNVEVLMPSH